MNTAVQSWEADQQSNNTCNAAKLSRGGASQLNLVVKLAEKPRQEL
jgi:hypothetical protein